MGGSPNYTSNVKEQKVLPAEEKHEPNDVRNMRLCIEGGQIKSFDKAKRIAMALSIIEEEMGVGSTSLIMSDVFICPDTDFDGLCETAMECYLKKHIDHMI